MPRFKTPQLGSFLSQTNPGLQSGTAAFLNGLTGASRNQGFQEGFNSAARGQSFLSTARKNNADADRTNQAIDGTNRGIRILQEKGANDPVFANQGIGAMLSIGRTNPDNFAKGLSELQNLNANKQAIEAVKSGNLDLGSALTQLSGNDPIRFFQPNKFGAFNSISGEQANPALINAATSAEQADADLNQAKASRVVPESEALIGVRNADAFNKNASGLKNKAEAVNRAQEFDQANLRFPLEQERLQAQIANEKSTGVNTDLRSAKVLAETRKVEQQIETIVQKRPLVMRKIISEIQGNRQGKPASGDAKQRTLDLIITELINKDRQLKRLPSQQKLTEAIELYDQLDTVFGDGQQSGGAQEVSISPQPNIPVQPFQPPPIEQQSALVTRKANAGDIQLNPNVIREGDDIVQSGGHTFNLSDMERTAEGMSVAEIQEEMARNLGSLPPELQAIMAERLGKVIARKKQGG